MYIAANGRRLREKSVTELAVLEIRDNKFYLIERAPGVSVEEIVFKTEGDLVVPAFVPEMVL
jgi:3-oxoacid CoA-transferase subunit B